MYYFGTSGHSQNVALEFLPNIMIARVFQYQGYESAHPPDSLNYANGGQILTYRLMSIIHFSGGHFKTYTDHQDAQYMVYDGLKPTNCKGVVTLKPGNIHSLNIAKDHTNTTLRKIRVSCIKCPIKL